MQTFCVTGSTYQPVNCIFILSCEWLIPEGTVLRLCRLYDFSVIGSSNKLSKNFDEVASQGGGIFFTWKSSSDIGQSGALQSAVAVALMPLLIVAAYTTAVTRSVFQWAPQKLPHPFGGSGLSLIHNSLGPPEPAVQTASGSVQSFCWVQKRDQQTDRHTDHSTPFVLIDRI